MNRLAEVLIRKNGSKKSIEITAFNKPKIEENIIEKWQLILNNLANIFDLPAALIMKIDEKAISVFLSSENKENIYKKGESERLGLGLYCETVLGENKQLIVEDALEDEIWKDNPDTKLNMISYLGVPIRWVDGELFGTLCVLDQKKRIFGPNIQSIFENFKRSIELDMELLYKNQIYIEENQFLQELIELIPSALIILNKDLIVEDINSHGIELLGHPKEALIGKRVSEGIVNGERVAIIEENFDGNGLSDFPIEIIDRFGVKNHFLINYSTIKDANDEIKNILLIVNDITKIKEVEENLRINNEILRELSIEDRLTNMYNHVTIYEILEKHLQESKRYNRPLSIAMIDLDDFKKINDEHGHRKGDDVLRSLSEIIMKEVRHADSVGRYGGEEFLIVLPETSVNEAFSVIERIRDSVEKYDFGGIRITVSAGISCFTKNNTHEEIVNRADRSLYRAKAIGKNVVIVDSIC
ncbi:MAG: diguanylate cyclase [Clostridiales bacterium]|nr:diguanylate cyclase [Clostridiales bacterium]